MKGKNFEICGEIKKAELVIMGNIPYIKFQMKRLDGIYMTGLARKGFENLIAGHTVTVLGSYTWQKHTNPKYGRQYLFMCHDVLRRHGLQAVRQAA